MKDTIKILLKENLQQAEKLYFKKHLLDDTAKQNVLAITHGDNFTRLVADLVFNSVKHHKTIDTYTWKMAQTFYDNLKTYNKNIFPVKYNLEDYGYFNNEPDQHIIELYALLFQRNIAIKEFQKLPSIGQRNLRYITKNPIKHEYDLKGTIEKINKIVRYIEYIPNNDRGAMIMKKIFNSKNNLDRTVDVAEHYGNLFSSPNEYTREDILSIASMVDSTIIQDSNNVLVIRVESQDAMRSIGCNSLWCFAVSHAQDFWNDYAQYGYVYVIFDFNEDPESTKFMMVHLPDSDTIYASNNIDLESLGIENPMGYLERIGVDTSLLSDEIRINSFGDEEDSEDSDADVDNSDEPVEKEPEDYWADKGLPNVKDPRQMSLFELWSKLFKN